MMSILNTSTRKRRRKKYLYLMNDNVNSFDTVRLALTSLIPGMNDIKATSIATIVHNNSQCNIYQGFAPEIYVLAAQLRKQGLRIQIHDKRL